MLKTHKLIVLLLCEVDKDGCALYLKDSLLQIKGGGGGGRTAATNPPCEATFYLTVC